MLDLWKRQYMYAMAATRKVPPITPIQRAGWWRGATSRSSASPIFLVGFLAGAPPARTGGWCTGRAGALVPGRVSMGRRAGMVAVVGLLLLEMRLAGAGWAGAAAGAAGAAGRASAAARWSRTPVRFFGKLPCDKRPPIAAGVDSGCPSCTIWSASRALLPGSLVMRGLSKLNCKRPEAASSVWPARSRMVSTSCRDLAWAQPSRSAVTGTRMGMEWSGLKI